MARSTPPAFAIALLVAAACAVVFAIFAGLSHGFTLQSVAGFAAFGATLVLLQLLTLSLRPLNTPLRGRYVALS